MDLLRREGFRDNHKRIYRAYREERLQVRRRQKKRAARWRGERLERLQGRTEIWAMDFIVRIAAALLAPTILTAPEPRVNAQSE